MSEQHDYIVVGSGPSGAMAAQTLVEAGVKVAMIDVGFDDSFYRDIIPDRSFVDIRKTDSDQHLYFLGKNFEGIPSGHIKTGPQLTPPRGYVVEGTDRLLPKNSDNFNPMESLAYGGLGSAWGLACFEYSVDELRAMGLGAEAIHKSYKTVAQRIGISGINQPFTDLEISMEKIKNAYENKKMQLNSHGVTLAQTALGLLTEDLGDRKATQYHDMDFWANQGNSAYRPAYTIEQLKKKSNFKYYGKNLVIKFSEKEGLVNLVVRNVETKAEQVFACQKLILACGALGTARIVMRSFDYKKEKLPLLCNDYCYFPSIQLRMLGNASSERKISYSQLTLFTKKTMAMLYSYSSLLLFRLAKETPFNFADAIRLQALIYPSLIIAGLHHSDRPSQSKYMRFKNDHLEANYELTAEEKIEHAQNEADMKYALRKLGCYPIKRVHPGYGASIHYGGTLPFDDSQKPFTISSSGRLGGVKNIYIADGSGFLHQPAKGPTFTLMANAHLVALKALNNE